MIPLAISTMMFTQVATATTVQANICHTLSVPAISQPKDNTITHQSGINVSGAAGPNTSITILDNSRSDGVVTSDSSGNFAGEVLLVSGQNTLVARAANACGDSADSAGVNVKYVVMPKSTVPQSSTTSPASSASSSANSGSTGSTTPQASPATKTSQPPTGNSLNLSVVGPLTFSTSQASVTVTGSTGIPGVQVVISSNGQVLAQLTSDGYGGFQALVPVKYGDNSLQIVATSGAKTATLMLHVTRTAAPVQPSTKSHLRGWILLTAFPALLIITSIVLYLRHSRAKHATEVNQ